MLVRVDTTNGTVQLIGSAVTTVSLASLDRLAKLLQGRTVQYISEVVEASGEEVFAMLADLAADPTVFKAPVMPETPARANSSGLTPVETDKRQWLYATGSGYMNVPAAKLRFDGPADFKDMNTLGSEFFDMYPIMKELLQKRSVRIVGTNEMNKLKKEAAAAQAKREAMMMKNSDGTDIIVDTRGGRIQGKRMDDLFTDVGSDDPPEAFISEEERLIQQYGFGKEEAAGEQEVEG